MADVVGLKPDTARGLVQMYRDQRGLGGGSVQQPRNLTDDRSVTFINESNSEVPSFGCMRIVGAELFNGRPRIRIDKPNDAKGPFLFNGPRPVPGNRMGQAQLSGLVVAKYGSGAPSTGEIWGPVTDWTLERSGSPALEIYGTITTQTSAVYGNSQFGPVVRLGVADADIDAGNSGTISIHEPDGAAIPDADYNNTAYLQWMHGSTQVSAGKEVAIIWMPEHGQWRILHAECE